MPPSEAATRRRSDPAALFALAWALVFGALYAEMIARTRAPRLVAAARRAIGPGGWIGRTSMR